MKYLLVMVSACIVLIVGVYIGELRMQVKELEDAPTQKTTPILKTMHVEPLDNKLIDLLK